MVTATEPLQRAADLMADPAIPLLPVVDPDDRLVSIVTRRDVLAAYRSISEV